MPVLIELGLVERRDRLAAAGHKRLFSEWQPYVKKTGEIRHGHALTKSWQYIKVKFEFTREDLSLYSARHSFAQRLDEVGKLAERSRHLAMGHSTGGKARLRYGAKNLNLEVATTINSIKDETVEEVSRILIAAKACARNAELQAIDILTLVQNGIQRSKAADDETAN
jgi:hypothetical protein